MTFFFGLDVDCRSGNIPYMHQNCVPFIPLLRLYIIVKAKLKEAPAHSKELCGFANC